MGGQYSALFFKSMVLIFRIADIFHDPGKKLTGFGIRPGDTVVDYGCGPGRHLRAAASLAGPQGRVYGADIHPLAISAVKRLAAQAGLTNLVPAEIRDGRSAVPDRAADLVYALDMFHRVDDPVPFLAEINRIVKPGGRLIIEDGHQSRTKTLAKLSLSPRWMVERETARDVRLRPV
jgi:ubiquinone/menaquinone biosynthesis C-methylase UbiE